MLKANFAHLAAGVDLSALPTQGWEAVAVFFLIGMFLTVLIQSSSATTAPALTAAGTGLLPLPHAALIIIGANVGSSSTAVLASVGANANARRVAASHVLFNVVTAVFAVAILPWLLPAVAAVAVIRGLPADPAVTLALFSTTFNGLGVVLMLPVTAAMVRFLRRRFVTPEEELARPRYFDPAALAVPE